MRTRRQKAPALILSDFRYNSSSMKTFLFIVAAFVFMVVNIVVACYVAIRLGYGPPNWQSALNLIVRLTTLQNYLNAGRDWLDKKAPWTEKYFDKLRIPKPIIIVDTTPEPEEPEAEAINGEWTEEQDEESSDKQVGDVPETA